MIYALTIVGIAVLGLTTLCLIAILCAPNELERMDTERL